jgi:hypothetical protein
MEVSFLTKSNYYNLCFSLELSKKKSGCGTKIL